MSSVGRLKKGLKVAEEKSWTVVDMKKITVFSFERNYFYGEEKILNNYFIIFLVFFLMITKIMFSDLANNSITFFYERLQEFYTNSRRWI